MRGERYSDGLWVKAAARACALLPLTHACPQRSLPTAPGQDTTRQPASQAARQAVLDMGRRVAHP